MGVSTWGKFVLSRHRGDKHRRSVPDAPSRGTPPESSSQAKFKDGAVWGLQKGPVIAGPAGSVFGEN